MLPTHSRKRLPAPSVHSLFETVVAFSTAYSIICASDMKLVILLQRSAFYAIKNREKLILQNTSKYYTVHIKTGTCKIIINAQKKKCHKPYSYWMQIIYYTVDFVFILHYGWWRFNPIPGKMAEPALLT